MANTRSQRARSTGISGGDVAKLKLKWAFGFPGVTTSFGTPTVVGGRVYIGSADGITYSLNASTAASTGHMRPMLVLGPALLSPQTAPSLTSATCMREFMRLTHRMECVCGRRTLMMTRGLLSPELQSWWTIDFTCRSRGPGKRRLPLIPNHFGSNTTRAAERRQRCQCARLKETGQSTVDDRGAQKYCASRSPTATRLPCWSARFNRAGVLRRRCACSSRRNFPLDCAPTPTHATRRTRATDSG
jgi:hypothetical protein